MHSGQRNPAGYGNRSSFGPRRGFGRGGGFSASSKPHQLPPPPPPPPPRKSDILFEAGRLAAEYLVSKGVIPPHLLPQRPPPPLDGARTPALSRLSGPDLGRLRRHTPDDDEYDSPRRKHWRARQRPGPYYVSDNVQDRSYSRGEYEDAYNYNCNYEEDDVAPGFSKKGSRSSSREEPPFMRSEIVVESHMIDDTASKVSTTSSWKDSNVEAEVVSNKAKISSLEMNQMATDREMKGLELDESGDSEMRDIAKGDIDGASSGECIDYRNKDSDLVKYLGFSKVPTKPRSTVVQRNQQLEQDLDVEENNGIEGGSPDVGQAIVEDVKIESDSCVKLDESTGCQIADNHSEHSILTIEQDSYLQTEGQLSIETKPTVDLEEKKEIQYANEKPEVENIQGSSPMEVSQVDEYAMQGFEMEQRNHYSGPMPKNDEMISDGGSQKTMDSGLLPELKAEPNVMIEEDRKSESKSFKIGDLNLIGCSEVNVATDSYAVNHAPVSVSNLKDEKELVVPFPLPLPTNAESFGNYDGQPDDEKFIPVINLEDDCSLEENDPSLPKSDPMYASLDNVLTHGEGSVELTGVQDGFGLVPQELLGNDIPGCPSVSSDLSNLQAGFGLPGAEVFPGDDIYVTLGELPIGFMEVWDQQNQEYGNFF